MERASARKTIESYRDLLVWQESMDTATEIYKIVGLLPLNEQYALSSQLRRAAGSVAANIAEGFGRWHKREFVRFLLIANGSVKELETHLLLAVKVGFLEAKRIEGSMHKAQDISKMIFALRNKLAS
jgi:four helix bundle protein